MCTRIAFTKIALSIAAVTVPTVLVGPPAQAVAARAVPGSTITLPLAGVEAEPDVGAPRQGRTAVLTGPRSTGAYSLLGVTWADPAAGARIAVHVRTHTGGVWSGWHELQAHGDGTGQPEGTTRRGGTEPFWAGSSDGVQVRVGVLEGEAPADLRAELVDPGDSIADAGLSRTPRTDPRADRGAAVAGLAAKPTIRTRKDWGADESIRDRNFKYTGTVKAVFVHHTADGNAYSCDESAKVIRSIYRYHVKTNGWADIGYNFVVDKCGTVFEGRAGGVDKAVLGAHTLGFNTDTTGIAALGTYTSTVPNDYLLTGIEKLIAWKLDPYGRDPKGKVTLTSSDSGSRYPRGTKHAFDVISGHRDGFNTECPGQKMYDKLREIRNEVTWRMG